MFVYVCVGVTFDLLSQFCVHVACYITLLNTRADKFAPVIATTVVRAVCMCVTETNL